MKRFFLITMMLVLVLGNARGQLVLRIKKSVEVCSKDVVLSDIVEDAALLPAKWTERRVMAAPEAGGMSYHALTAIAYALSHYDDMQNITLSGEPVVTISRKDRKIEKEEFEKPLLAYLKKTDPWKDLDLKVNVLNIPTNTRVPVGDTTYRIRQIDQKTSKGYSLAHIAVVVDGVEAAEVPVGVEIKLMAEVWVTTRNIEMGHILDEEDLRSEMHVVDAMANTLSSAEDPTGFEVNRTLAAGSLLRSNDIKKPLCAKRGEWVAITAIGKNLQITLRGKALANGRLGDRIMCVNERSNRQVLVELTGSGNGVLVRL